MLSCNSLQICNICMESVLMENFNEHYNNCKYKYCVYKSMKKDEITKNTKILKERGLI